MRLTAIPANAPSRETPAATRTARIERFCYALLEVLLILALFVAYAGRPVPDVGESHYMAKAKHFATPEWCARDLFLQSAEAHYFFFVVVSPLTKVLPLAAATWAARLAGWLMLAIGWQRLSASVVPIRLMSVLSAAWLLALQHWCSMSGEWVVGGIEAKVFAYSFAFLGLAALVRGNWHTPWLWWGLAALFHVLVGGWCFVAGAIAWLVTPPPRPRWLSTAGWSLAGGLLALPSVAIGLRLSSSAVSESMSALANRILVYHRLAHHLDLGAFLPRQIALFVGLTVAWWFLSGWVGTTSAAQQRLRRFACGTVVIALAGVAIHLLATWVPEIAASLLKFYWYRLADVMIPAAMALSLAGAVPHLGAERYLTSQRWLALLIVGATALLLPIVHQSVMDPRPRSIALWDNPARPLAARRERTEEWIAMCTWVDEHTPADALFITPWSQQTFKWYAQRAEVFNWKDVPQDTAHLIEWRRRWKTVFPTAAFREGHSALSDEQLLSIAGKYGAEYLVMQRWRMQRPLGEAFELVYPAVQDENESFAVYRILPRPAEAAE